MRALGLPLALATVIVGAVPSVSGACPRCRPKVNAAVYTPAFGGTLARLFLPLGLMVGIAVGAGQLDRPAERRKG